jgi:D-arabinose 5-phosphate isomerase GutQ
MLALSELVMHKKESLTLLLTVKTEINVPLIIVTQKRDANLLKNSSQKIALQKQQDVTEMLFASNIWA